ARIQAAIGQIEVQWMRSHLSSEQGRALGVPEAYLAGNAAADLLAGEAVKDAAPPPQEHLLWRGLAAAARHFWSLFAKVARPPEKHGENPMRAPVRSELAEEVPQPAQRLSWKPPEHVPEGQVRARAEDLEEEEEVRV
ncbi:unnamed protein product, partial [Durusdinium trenchii]